MSTTYLGEESHGHKGEKPPYDFHVGDTVVYHPVGASPNTTVGIIQDILQEPEVVGEGRPVNVRASEEEPRFVCIIAQPVSFASLSFHLVD